MSGASNKMMHDVGIEKPDLYSALSQTEKISCQLLTSLLPYMRFSYQWLLTVYQQFNVDLRNYIHLLLFCTIVLKVFFYERCNALLDFAVSIMMCISDNTGPSPNFNYCGHCHTTYQSVKSFVKCLARQFLYHAVRYFQRHVLTGTIVHLTPTFLSNWCNRYFPRRWKEWSAKI